MGKPPWPGDTSPSSASNRPRLLAMEVTLYLPDLRSPSISGMMELALRGLGLVS